MSLRPGLISPRVIAGGSALSGAILSLTPAGYWKLDETSGTVITDSSGNARHGTYEGIYTLSDVIGPDGIDYVTFGGGRGNIPDNDDWSQDNSGVGLTVFCLVRPTANTLGAFVAKDQANLREWRFAMDTGGELMIEMMTNGNSIRSRRVSNVGGTAALNTWQAFASAMPHHADSSVLPTLNKNGTNIVGATSGGSTAFTNNTAPLTIGNIADAASGYDFTGAIAHVAMFAEQLSAPDMATLMAAASSDGWF